MAAKCKDEEGTIKIYSVEAYNSEEKPGLVRREEPKDNGEPGKLIERLTIDDAHKKYACMSYEDLNELLDRLDQILLLSEDGGI